MNKILVGLLALGLSTTASAGDIRQAGRFGLGIGGGLGVTGLSGKYFFSEDMALEGVAGVWGLGRNDGDFDDDDVLGLNFNLLFELPTIADGEVVELGWSAGPGVFVGVGDAAWFGVNGALGLELNFHAIPLDIVLEYQPGFLIEPYTDLDLVNFGGHIRVYF